MQSLRSFYSDLYEPLALRSRRPNTKLLYQHTLKMFDRFLGRSAKLADLNDATVSKFAAYRSQQGRSKCTVNRDLCNLLAMWRWAHRKGYVTNWPDVQKEKRPEKAPIAMLREELDLLAQTINQIEEPIGDYEGKDFWNALFRLVWDTGERIGAVIAIEWHQVDLRGRWVRFDAEHRKGGQADNHLPIAEDTAEALAKLNPYHGKVFKWPYCRNYLWQKWGKVMEKAGLPNARQFKFHCIRKSTASHFEAAGGNATELLGHSSRKITKAYLDKRVVSQRSAIDLLFRPGCAKIRDHEGETS